MRTDSFILVTLNLIAKFTGIVVAILISLIIFLIKQVFYCLYGCFRVLFASTDTKCTAILLILMAVLDASIVYRFTNQYRYSPYIHLLIIVSPGFYLASVGRRPGILEKGVYVDDK
jgi:hypothetical protein